MAAFRAALRGGCESSKRFCWPDAVNRRTKTRAARDYDSDARFYTAPVGIGCGGRYVSGGRSYRSLYANSINCNDAGGFLCQLPSQDIELPRTYIRPMAKIHISAMRFQRVSLRRQTTGRGKAYQNCQVFTAASIIQTTDPSYNVTNEAHGRAYCELSFSRDTIARLLATVPKRGDWYALQ